MARLSYSDINVLAALNPRFIKFLQDEQATATPLLSIADVTVLPGALSATMQLSLSAQPRDTIVCSWLTRNGIGTNQGTNYVAASGAIVWQPEEPLTKTITIALKGNNLVGNSVQVILSSTIFGAKLGQSTGSVLFSNDPAAPPSGLNLVFSHDFINGFDATPNGLTAVGANCWKSQLAHGRTQPGNKELGYYADATSVPAANPFPIVNGKRAVRSEYFPNGVLDAAGHTIPCPWSIINGVTQPFYYTAAVLTSQNWPAAQVGPGMRVECRLAMPVNGQRGAWPAFWLMPTSGAWPPEIDMMEWPIRADANPWTYYTTQHWPSPTGGDSTRGYPVDIRLLGIPGITDLTDFHTYGVTIRDSGLTFDLDGQRTITMDNRSPGQSWYILLNMAMGGSWPASPTAATQFPCDMLIDWLKIYKLV